MNQAKGAAVMKQCNSLIWVLGFAAAIWLSEIPASAQESISQKQIDDAYARLKSKQIATTQHTSAGESTHHATTQAKVIYPAINGVWQEGEGILVHVTQDGGDWSAECTYSSPEVGTVRWEIKHGTVSRDGTLRGKLEHIQSPDGWTKSQDRQGKLSEDAQTISGTAFFDKAPHPFTWKRVHEEDPLAPRQSTTKNEYDRFKDETTLQTPDIVDVPGPAGGVREVRLAFSATFKGHTIQGEKPECDLILSLLADGPVDVADGKLRLLVDDNKVTLPQSIDRATVGGEVLAFQIGRDQLHSLASAKKIEGQIGLVEFQLSADQVREIADLYAKSFP